MLFLVKKPGILNLTFRRGQINLSIVFIFVSCEVNGYFRVASVGQLSFDCRSGPVRSRRMQGGFEPWLGTLHCALEQNSASLHLGV